MEEIAKQLSTPAFWAMTVFVGLLLNVLGGYMKEWTDKAVSVLSGAYKAKLSRESAEFDARVQAAAQSEAELLLLQNKAEILRNLSLKLLVMAVLLSVLACLSVLIASVNRPPGMPLPNAGGLAWTYVALLSLLLGLELASGDRASAMERIIAAALRRRIAQEKTSA